MINVSVIFPDGRIYVIDLPAMPRIDELISYNGFTYRVTAVKYAVTEDDSRRSGRAVVAVRDV